MNFKKYLPSLFTMILIVSGATALWLGNIYISGLFSATSGAKPSEAIFTEDITITNNDPIYFEKTFTNTDGAKNYQFVANFSGIASTDVKCDYEITKDFVMSINTTTSNSANILSSPTMELHSGENVISFKVMPDINRCPLNGTWNVRAEIV